MLKVEAVLTPKLYDLYANDDSIVVIIDVLRASSAMITAFEHGVEKMIPVASVEEALAYKEKGFLVGAERDGEQVEGFDFGNSPYSYMSEDIKGKTVVLTTTNGTKAIEISKNAYKVVVGAFINLDALSDWLISQERDVILLCAGWKDRFNLEDTLFAGAVIDRLSQHENYTELSDASLAAKYLYHTAKDDTSKFLKNSSHRNRLKRLNLKEDIRYSLTLNLSTVIPVLEDGVLVKMSK